MADKGHISESTRRDGMLGGMRFWFVLGLLALLVLCLAFSWNTRDAMAHLSFLRGSNAAGPNSQLVDLRPWQTAQILAALAVTAEETELARAAERNADHEVDQAFAAALREAGMKRSALTGEALALSQKVARIQQTVNDEQARVDSLTKAAKPSSAPATDTSDLDVAKAQLGLDSDELADAQQDLARAGGDDRERIQRELAAHEASMKQYDAQASNPTEGAVVSAQRRGSLAGRVNAWLDQRTRYQLVEQAVQQADADAAALAVKHEATESQGNVAASAGSQAASADRAAILANLKDRSARSQLLAIYDDRIESHKQLGAIYRKWDAQLLLQHRIVLHLILQSLALIAFILVCVILLDALAVHFVERPTLDRRRAHTLRVVFKLGTQLTGALLVLLVVFGVPSQMPTILGFTTAGLTVVLQDFIIAFFGWFVLMGKNGIRIGDRVEIDGVAGEVIEVGLFRTSMLETGNWTDKGHPTGRRIAFLNSFAIRGQYLNFSTTSQWMWDEIRFGIPAASDAHGLIELIRKAVVEETDADTSLAEAEWKRDSTKSALGQLSAEPAVEMRPGASGIDIVVRYVSRATDRFDTRNRLYERVVALLQNPPAPSETASGPPPRLS
jgi:small-conductance mechanosensitive channel